ncbi:alpha-amylase [candidate division KSB1 bacterium]|nr:alpha-amylase [candidate division KSB1 bacterium]NIR73001.1 alpha-amylase [candidate division KSB1 bacterium]NIS28275.1 alpha-amylase [candidate division KSB1 bacterium]NIT75147.1 alpha-amylase [candidate division KSB1 bacterium]NIU28954.1 alpha-amylase [candidate division KSB1 bacterium]
MIYIIERELNALLPTPEVGCFEFHVSRHARDKYEFEEAIFSSTGNVIFANFHAARLFAQKMNEKRDLIQAPEQTVRAGLINAMGLLDEILHYVISQYRQQINPKLFEESLAWLESEIGSDEVDRSLRKFVEEFPAIAVYKKQTDVATYLKSSTDGIPNREIVLEEMLMLWVSNENPALSPFMELFDDEALEKETAYLEIVQSLRDFFETQPVFGPDNQNLIDMLRAPALASPDSLEGQLRFIRQRWGVMLGSFLQRLFSSLDFIREENKALFFGPGPTQVAEFGLIEHEPEQFSPDLHWMPRLVLLAKSTLVWLDQLSKKYQRSITRLDQIPDEELDSLARWGFTGLWLIGVWERSPASKKIKQNCGNPEAESSAYSLFDYEISHSLGGHEALQNLKQRCWQRGIRLASDMVPNHTGLDSRWIREHPDWFISLPYSPFPSYTFNGASYSGDPRYGIFIEDKYYDRTDAAVVFKREDYWTGDVHYIYHGNDGTSMPWNDTAQLDYLNPEVREAVIQKILDVARMFPVIRFDAAMTLAKKHYQRLWYPEPGHGGDIPSRAEYGMTRDVFNQRIPNEFWREVVDRVAQELPDTLLLAEAFWLMEGYFVRSLGMHRVYNSAFMNMLKNEENEKYRNTIKNTIQFNPEILKRYVNFMNNPDEETAVAQFGKDDKYFGVCMMMVTMPGLPMFGHGQVEGFVEKYGMEYSRAYMEEQVDWNLVHRHEREIFPLMKKRYVFAEVENFLLYDFFVPDGHVNENVFAYSNRFGEERGLVVYNNKFEQTSGWIRNATAYAVKTGSGDETKLVQKTLGKGLALHHEEDYYCIFRDYISGLQYIRNCRELCEKGIFVELDAFKYHVFLDFQQVHDNEQRQYAQLTAHLNGRGVPSIQEEFKELTLSPLLAALDSLLNTEMVNRFMNNRSKIRKKAEKAFSSEFEERYSELLKQVDHFSSGNGNQDEVAKTIRKKLDVALSLDGIDKRISEPGQKSRKFQSAIKYLKNGLNQDAFSWTTLFSWLVVHELGKLATDKNYEQRSRSWIDEWLFGKRVERVFANQEASDEQKWQGKWLVNLLTSHQNWHVNYKAKKGQEYLIFNDLFNSLELPQFLNVHRYDGILWFNKERFEQILWWLFAIAVVQIVSRTRVTKDKAIQEIGQVFDIVNKWLAAEKESEYQVEKLWESLKAKSGFTEKKTGSSNQEGGRAKTGVKRKKKEKQW